MVEPKDPKESQKITLDLELGPPTSSEGSQPTQFREFHATVQRQHPSKPPTKAAGAPRYRSKGRKAPKTKGPSKTLFIIGGVLITALLGLQYFDSQSPSGKVPRTAPPKMSAKAAKSVLTNSLPPAPPPSSPPSTDPYAGMRSAGLDQLGTEIDEKGNTFFAVRVKPKHVCHPADVEAMRNVFGNSGTLLLSLEPMADDKPKTPITRTISINEIVEGTKLSLPVNLKDSGVYGIYICGDAANTRSCGGKKPADFNRILNFRELDVAANAVFYYQFAVLGLDYATVYGGLSSGIPDVRDEIQARKPEKNWKPQLEKAAALMQGVKSLPPRTRVEGNVVTLELQVAMIKPDGSCR